MPSGAGFPNTLLAGGIFRSPSSGIPCAGCPSLPCIAPPLAGGWCMRRRMTHACRLRLRSPSLTPPAIAPVRPRLLDSLKELCRETLRCLSRGRKIAQKHHQPQRLQLPVRRTPGSGHSSHRRWVVPARPAHSQLHRDVDIEDHWWPAQHDALVDAFALIAQGGGPHGFVCPGVGPSRAQSTALARVQFPGPN